MLINLRNALMSGKRLPYDAELEYLESTGTQWINTGVKVYNDTNVEITVKVNTQSEVAFIGSATSTDRFVIRSYSGSLSYGFGSWWANTAATLYNQWRTLRTDVSVPTVYCDDTSYPTSNTPSAKSGTDSILIFDSFRANRGDVAVAGVKIWRGSTLVFDGIPVRKDTTGELYDRVSGKFAERHGDFVLGPDVVPVEYIESTGVQYIDTGIVPDASTGLRILFQHTSASDQYVAGLREGTGNTRWVVGESTSPYLGYGTVYNTTLAVRVLNESLLNYKNDGKGVISAGGGSTIHSLSALAFTPTRDIRLFGAKGPSSIQSQGYMKANVKIYSAEITQGDKPVRNYKAIRVGTGSTWEGAMMDVLTRRIYRNAGTGAFTYGNDLRYPIPAE